MALTRLLMPHVRVASKNLLQTPSIAHRNVLGLDVSTKAIGIGITNLAGQLVHTEVITATGEESVFDIAAAVSERVAEINQDYHFCQVAIEDVMKSFAAGRFSTQGLFTLARLNGIVGFECWRRLEAPVGVYMPNAIRSFFDVKSRTFDSELLTALAALDALPDGMEASVKLIASTGRRKLRKEEATKYSVLMYLVSVFGKDLSSTFTFTRTGSLHMTTYDRTDAILTAMYGCVKFVENSILGNSTLVSESYSAIQAAVKSKTEPFGSLTRFREVHDYLQRMEARQTGVPTEVPNLKVSAEEHKCYQAFRDAVSSCLHAVMAAPQECDGSLPLWKPHTTVPA